MQVVLIRLVPVRTPCGCITASSLTTALRSSVLGVCMRRLFGLVQDRALIPTINGRTQGIWIGFRLVRLQSLIHGTQRCREMRTTTYVHTYIRYALQKQKSLVISSGIFLWTNRSSCLLEGSMSHDDLASWGSEQISQR